MAGFGEYDQYDGLGLARLLRQGALSPAELLEEAIGRVERLNPALNAVVAKQFEKARARAATAPQGPFGGVPFLVKDLQYEQAGEASSYGCRALAGHKAESDSEMIRRLNAAGLLIMGRTNTPEFGLMGITEPELFGPARNPWNKERTPGGSSGGSAAAVAAGMVPLAGGGDGGGSIRIPASYCGLFGLKPSRGRTPTGPAGGRVWQGAVTENAITRSVADSAAALDAVAGPDQGAPLSIAPPARPFVEEVGATPGQLKVALNTDSPLGEPVDPECRAAALGAAQLLEELGHRVEEAAPRIDGQELANSYLTLYFGEVAADLDALAPILGRPARPGDVEPLTWTLGLLGRAFSARHFVKAMRVWDRAARAMGSLFQNYDLYLTPTTAAPPAEVGGLAPKPAEALMMKVVNALRAGWLLKASGLVDQMATRSLAATPFTQLANLAGLPAMSVPLHWGADGLPYGSQFMAPLGREDLLFRLAGQLEQARPWFGKRPPSSQAAA